MKRLLHCKSPQKPLTRGSKSFPSSDGSSSCSPDSLAKEFRVVIYGREVASNQDLKALSCEQHRF